MEDGDGDAKRRTMAATAAIGRAAERERCAAGQWIDAAGGDGSSSSSSTFTGEAGHAGSRPCNGNLDDSAVAGTGFEAAVRKPTLNGADPRLAAGNVVSKALTAGEGEGLAVGTSVKSEGFGDGQSAVPPWVATAADGGGLGAFFGGAFNTGSMRAACKPVGPPDAGFADASALDADSAAPPWLRHLAPICAARRLKRSASAAISDVSDPVGLAASSETLGAIPVLALGLLSSGASGRSQAKGAITSPPTQSTRFKTA